MGYTHARSIWIRGMAISFMAIHMGRVIGGTLKRFWPSTVNYGSLCTRIYHSVCTPLSVLSHFLFADERTHYEQPFNPLFITHYWVVGVIRPYDCDSLINASSDTR
eukprot:1355715-Pleurochrysis_carterae.AAC.2